MFAFRLRSPVCARPCQKFYSTPAAGKTNIKLVAELRKLTSAPISKARQALAEANGDIQGALAWLEKDMAESGAAKAEKVKGRVANEGLIGTSVVSRGLARGADATVKAAIIELNCESDFVGRTDEFGFLASSIARTVADASKKTNAASFSPLELSEILPLTLHNSEKTVEASIIDIIARIGENISLRRAAAIHYTPSGEVGHVGSYSHTPSPKYPSAGRMSALSLLTLRSPKIASLFDDPAFSEDVERMDRVLSRQIAGFAPTAIGDATTTDETHLYGQAFMMHGGPEASMLVRDVLQQWRKKWELDSCEVDGFVRWHVGEEI